MRLSHRLDKRAAWGPAPTMLDWYAFIAAVLIIVVAAVVFSIHAEEIEGKLREANFSNNDERILFGLLRAPVEVEGIKIDIAQLIGLWYSNPEGYSGIASERISMILNEFYDSEMGWNIEVVGEEKVLGEASGKKILESAFSLPLVGGKFVQMKMNVFLKRVKEGSWCYNPLSLACSSDNKACSCDRIGYKMLWTNCRECPAKCEDGICK